ncbi:MAG: zf-HC2 domain-containing protein [Terracidiphilus sp.]
MTPCNRAPAVENASRYVEGTLSQLETEQFEDHYWNCPACLAYLQALQAVSDQLAREPLPQITPVARKPVFAWPVLGWSLGAVAAAAILIVIGVQTLGPHAPRPSQATTPSSPVQTAPSPQVAHSSPAQETPVQLADLALPPFEAVNLRGPSEEVHFEEGMKAYVRGDCKSALATLGQVPVHDKQAHAAEFYSAACQMHLGDLAAAAARFQKVAFLGDSLHQESAFYYLAQIDLARNDPAKAHWYLQRTIALQGDFERRARLQDQKVRALENTTRDTGAKDGNAK